MRTNERNDSTEFSAAVKFSSKRIRRKFAALVIFSLKNKTISEILEAAQIIENLNNCDCWGTFTFENYLKNINKIKHKIKKKEKKKRRIIPHSS